VAADATVTWEKGLDCKGYRLPTEGEWEYAARVGTTTSFFGGTIDATMKQDRRGLVRHFLVREAGIEPLEAAVRR